MEIESYILAEGLAQATPLGAPRPRRWPTSGVRTLIAVLVALLSWTTTLAPAHAAEDDRQRAEKLIQEGLNLARAKQFREAIPKFEAALKLYPHPETQHNLGRAHEELGELEKAYEYFSKALQQDYVFAADGRARLARIEAELRKTNARLTVRTTPSVATVVMTFANGKEDTRVSSPFQAWVPAGRTRLVSSNPSFKTSEQKLDLAAGEDRELNVVLVPLPKKGFVQVSVNVAGATISLSGEVLGKSPLPSTPWDEGVYDLEVKLKGYVPHRESLIVKPDGVVAVNVALKPDATDPPEVVDTPTSGVPAWVGWTLVGTGAAAGGVAAYLQFGKAKPLEREANALAPTAETQAEYDRLRSRALKYQTAAIVTGITGGVLAATGIYLLLAEGETSEAHAPAFVPGVALGPDGGMVTGAFTF